MIFIVFLFIAGLVFLRSRRARTQGQGFKTDFRLSQQAKKTVIIVFLALLLIFLLKLMGKIAVFVFAVILLISLLFLKRS